MKSIIFRYTTSILFGLALAMPILTAGQLVEAPRVYAQEEGYSEEYRDTNTSEVDLTTASGLVRIFLGMIGIIFVITLIMGGVKLATSSSNNELIGIAYRTLAIGGIGLGVVITVYIIAVYVIDSLSASNI
ncbi:MAG: hypothetical protein ABH826_00290 [Patescibacteria group bacterium]